MVNNDIISYLCNKWNTLSFSYVIDMFHQYNNYGILLTYYHNKMHACAHEVCYVINNNKLSIYIAPHRRSCAWCFTLNLYISDFVRLTNTNLN